MADANSRVQNDQGLRIGYRPRPGLGYCGLTAAGDGSYCNTIPSRGSLSPQPFELIMTGERPVARLHFERRARQRERFGAARRENAAASRALPCRERRNCLNVARACWERGIILQQ
jgi:hypothetical protein